MLKLIRSLDVIGASLQEVYTKGRSLTRVPQSILLRNADTTSPDQIMSFINEIDYYLDCQQREKGRKLTGQIPTVSEYWETRLGTSAVTSMLALNEYEQLH